jgi:hypothetical protein
LRTAAQTLAEAVRGIDEFCSRFGCADPPQRDGLHASQQPTLVRVLFGPESEEESSKKMRHYFHD